MPDRDDGDTLDSLDDLLWLIREMEGAISTLDQLLDDCGARQIGCTPADLSRLVAEGQARGLIEVWTSGGEGYVTLTALAADHLGVQLGAASDKWFRRGWVPPEKVSRQPGFVDLDPTQVLSGGYRPGDEHRPGRKALMDRSAWIDPTLPEPIDVIVDIEEYGTLLGPGQRRLRDGSQVIVNRILGIGHPWPAAFDPIVEVIEGEGFALVRRVCRGCLTDLAAPRARLPRNAYCSICDRAGVDGKMPAIERELRQDGRKAYAPADLKGGVDVKAAKARKRARGKAGVAA